MSGSGRPGGGPDDTWRDDAWRDPGNDPTRPLPPQPPSSSSADGTHRTWEAEVPARRSGSDPAGGAAQPGSSPSDPDSSGGGRKVLVGLLGAVIGFVLAFLVIALTTDEPQAADPGAGQAQERIDELETDLAARDLSIEELEAQLAEAEAAAGDSDADIEEQREALDERASALDQRADALDARETELDEREADLAEREQQAPTAPEPDESPDSDTDPESDSGLNAPDIDEQEVENIVNRVLERLRELFN